MTQVTTFPVARLSLFRRRRRESTFANQAMASLSVESFLPFGRMIGSSKRRDQLIYFSGSRSRFMTNLILSDWTSVW